MWLQGAVFDGIKVVQVVPGQQRRCLRSVFSLFNSHMLKKRLLKTLSRGQTGRDPLTSACVCVTVYCCHCSHDFARSCVSVVELCF